MEAFEIQNVSFAYPQGKKRALKNISLTMEEGSFVTLCGRSGSGKSTLLRQLKKVLTPHGLRQGKILFFGQDLDQLSLRTQASEIGYVLQNPDNQIVTDKVWHELAFGLESLGYPTQTIRLRVGEMASFFGIQTWFHRRVTELSGGQKQLLNLASIMAMQPKALLLDEPTSQLDPIAASDFLETIRRINQELGITVLMTEHRLEEVLPMSDRVILLEEGEIFADGTAEEVGRQLREKQHPMLEAMPSPMQIYAGVDNDLPCPITVREGRRWMSQVLRSTPSSMPTKGSFAQDPEEHAQIKESSLPRQEDSALSKEQLDKEQLDKEQLTSDKEQDASDKEQLDKEQLAPVRENPEMVEKELVKSGSLPEQQDDLKKGKTGFAHLLSQGKKLWIPSKMPENVLISMKEVWFRYDQALPDVLKDLSLEVKKGELLAIVGGNGTGKTTALSVLCGIQKPYRGTVSMFQNEAQDSPPGVFGKGKVSPKIGLLPQNPQSIFVGKSVERDLLEMLRGEGQSKEQKQRDIDQVLALTEMQEYRHTHPYDLSGGEQQRAALAKVLLLKPDLLLLDEPTKGLDGHFKRIFAEILQNLLQKGTTIVMVSHDVEFCARYADRCAMFFDGSILSIQPTKAFFQGNTFYTTAANRMARQVFPQCVTAQEVIQAMNSARLKPQEGKGRSRELPDHMGR